MPYDFIDAESDIVLLATEPFWGGPYFPFSAKNPHFLRVHFHSYWITFASQNILTATIWRGCATASFKSGPSWTAILAEIGAVGWPDDDGGLRRKREQCDRADVLRGDSFRSERTDPRVAVSCVVEVQFRTRLFIHI